MWTYLCGERFNLPTLKGADVIFLKIGTSGQNLALLWQFINVLLVNSLNFFSFMSNLLDLQYKV